MRTFGVYLIFAAVALRSAVVFSNEPRSLVVVLLLSAYGLLLLAENWFIGRIPTNPPLTTTWPVLVYLVLQSGLAAALLLTPPFEDFFALLFIPLSLDGVTYLGRRPGYWCIAFFALALTGALVASPDEGSLFGLAMGILYSGVCVLFGGYARQVHMAEAAHNQNQQTFHELQATHRHLQGYADQVAALAVEHERNRLARDLHDSVTQTVFSMNLTAQSARLLLDKEPRRASAQLFHLEELAAGALREIQTLVSQLRPDPPRKESLFTSLRQLAVERQERDDLQVMLEVSGEMELPETVAGGLLSIAREALANITKHAGVCEAVIRLNLDGAVPCMEIEDHGRGFNPLAVPPQSGHLGLAGMSERAQEIGWQLSVESHPGQGTRVLVREDPSGARA